MQDKRVSRNEAGYSEKLRPAVPVGFVSLLLKRASVIADVITYNKHRILNQNQC